MTTENRIREFIATLDYGANIADYLYAFDFAEIEDTEELVSQFRDNSYDMEIIEANIDIYTNDLKEWAKSNDNLDYLDRVISNEEGFSFEFTDFIDLVTKAQWLYHYEKLNKDLEALEGFDYEA